MQVKVNKEIGSCGCGRSPNGKCNGWHGLSQEQYEEKLKEIREDLDKIAERSYN